MTYPSADIVWAREREFHDAIAKELDVDALPMPGRPEGLDLALIELAGRLKGSRVLDAGCGQGDLTLYLLSEGAVVTALDISPGMIDVVRRRAERLPLHVAQRLTSICAPLEGSGLPDSTFDLVLGKFILHHLDIEACADELERLLRPGGRAVFIENTSRNPLLAFARKRLAGRFGIPRYGTEDEHPLSARDLDALTERFSRATTHHPVFDFFVLLDRQLTQFRYPRVSRLMRALDDSVYRYAPRLRKYSYRAIVELKKEAE